MKNNALSLLEPFIGEWEYTMYNGWFLESMDATAKAFTTIEWLHDAFLMVRNTGAGKKPDDTWVIGYSDASEKYGLFYHDRRGVARIFDLTFDGRKMIFRRKDKDLLQKVSLEIRKKGLHSVTEASDDMGRTWRKNLEMDYTRIKRS